MHTFIYWWNIKQIKIWNTNEIEICKVVAINQVFPKICNKINLIISGGNQIILRFQWFDIYLNWNFLTFPNLSFRVQIHDRLRNPDLLFYLRSLRQTHLFYQFLKDISQFILWSLNKLFRLLFVYQNRLHAYNPHQILRILFRFHRLLKEKMIEN